ncbi:hypothetical protein [Flavobacterium sp. ZS1P14]|uniref:hypothetical protein n=1 Tax=Flavobacterium sp. ZS1P14 TaxID=3401729 RepID=UPI003AAA6E0D
MKKRIKKTYICKDINDYTIDETVLTDYHPKVGDVGIFEIIKIGKHKAVEDEDKRNATIIPSDLMMAAFGNRYATAQFEGYVPDKCDEELHILGAGGIVGVVHSMHYNYIDIGPTTIRLVGLVKDNLGNVINTKGIQQSNMASYTGAGATATKVILSIGSSMDSGKTTSAAYMVNGLKNAGYKVAYIKLTGTAYTKDRDLNYDLGADITADFSDFGFPSTYLCEETELFDLYESLLQKVITIKPAYTVIEIADGLYQRETIMLLTDPKFKKTIHSVIFSAGDSLAAINGVNSLTSWGLPPFVLSGLFTASPLLIKEIKKYTTIPVLNIEELSANGVELLHKFENKGSLLKAL